MGLQKIGKKIKKQTAQAVQKAQSTAKPSQTPKKTGAQTAARKAGGAAAQKVQYYSNKNKGGARRTGTAVKNKVGAKVKANKNTPSLYQRQKTAQANVKMRQLNIPTMTKDYLKNPQKNPLDRRDLLSQIGGALQAAQNPADRFHGLKERSVTRSPMEQLRADAMAGRGAWASDLRVETQKSDKEKAKEIVENSKRYFRNKKIARQDLSEWDRRNMNAAQQRQVQEAKLRYKEAQKAGKKEDAARAHREAENLRGLHGYSGGAAGDQFIRPELSQGEYNALNIQGELAMRQARMARQRAVTEDEIARADKRIEAILRAPGYREGPVTDADTGRGWSFGPEGRRMWAGTREQNAEDARQSRAALQATGEGIVGGLAYAGQIANRANRDRYEAANMDQWIVDADDYISAQSDLEYYDNFVRQFGRAPDDMPNRNVLVMRLNRAIQARAQLERVQGDVDSLYFDPTMAEVLGLPTTRDETFGERMLRQAAEHQVEATEGMTGAERFLTDAMISTGQSLPGMALGTIPGIGPALGLGVLGAQATGSRAYELTQQGLTAGEALRGGLISGGIEILTEKLPLEHFAKIVSGKSGRAAIKNILRQAGLEGTEEAVSYVGNYVADVAQNNPDAQFSWAELLENAGMGAVSGGIFGVGGSLIGEGRGRAAMPQIGDIQARTQEQAEAITQVQDLVSDERTQEARSLLEDTKAYNEMKQTGLYSQDELGMMRDALNERYARLAGVEEVPQTVTEPAPRTLEEAAQQRTMDVQPEMPPVQWERSKFPPSSLVGSLIDAARENNARNKAAEQLRVDQAAFRAQQVQREAQAAQTQAQPAQTQMAERQVQPVGQERSMAQQSSQVQRDILARNVSAFGENGRKAIMEAYQGGDAGTYRQAFAQVYDQALSGKTQEQIAQPRALTEPQFYAAVQSGMNDREAARSAGRVAGRNKNAGVDWRDQYVRQMDRRTAKMVDGVARALGVQVVFADEGSILTGTGAQANAEIIGNVVRIEKNNPNPVRKLIGHELTHRMQDLSPETYQTFRDYVMSIPGAQNALEQTLALYESGTGSFTREAAMDELAADFAGELWDSSEKLQDFIRKNYTNRTLLERVRDVFRALAAKLTGREKVQADEAVRLLEDALGAASEAVETMELGTSRTEKGGKRFSLSSPVEETDRFIASHNLNAEKMRGALELGGLAMPSVAMTPANIAHTGYGDITVVFGKDSVDPKDKRNQIFSDDAYTPTVPEAGYKISSDVTKRLRERIDALLDGQPSDLRSKVALDTENIRDNIQRWGEDFGKVYGDNIALKTAYLIDQGETIKVPMRYAATSSGMDKATIRKAIRMFGDMDKLDSADKLDAFIEPARELERQYYREKFPKKPELADTLVENFGWSDVDKLRNDAQYLKRHGDLRKITDLDALEKTVSRKLGTKKKQAAFEAWLRRESEGIIEKKGIRNDKDIFTRTGNRRSFEQLYDDYNLANIVKAMQQDVKQGKVGFLTGSGNIRGAAAKTYGSIEDARKEIGRIWETGKDEDFTAQYKAFDQRCRDLCAEMTEGTRLAAWDAAEALTETLAKHKTEPAIYRYLMKEWGSDGYLNITPEIAQEAAELIKEAQKLPIHYMEAKLYRAVDLTEPLAYVVPSNLDKDLKQQMKDAGLPMKTYKAGDREDRLNKVNAVKGARFSISARTDADYMAAVEAGDMKTAQRMVDEAAKAAGYTIKAYHGTPKKFNEFSKFRIGSTTDYGWFGRGFYFTTKKDVADVYAGHLQDSNVIEAYLKVQNPFVFTEYPGGEDMSPGEIMETVMGKKYGRRGEMTEDDKAQRSEDFSEWLVENGYDGVKIWSQIMILESEQAKRTDPVTYDDDGNVIPLSERFNEGKQDIRYSISAQTESPEFKQWFGDWQNDPEHASKVVNEDGTPKVVYHGTLAKGLHEFNKDFIGSRYAADDVGFFFTSRESIAQDYAVSEFDSNTKGEVIPAYLDMKTPLVFDGQYAKANGYGNIFRDNDVIDVWDNFQGAILEEIEGQGYDGIILDDGTDQMYVAFEPTQIKSATSNIGTFDRTNPDIRYSISAKTEDRYMDAVKTGDMETAQRMVDQAAKAAGYNTKPYYHGTFKAFTRFETAHSSKDNDLGPGIYLTNDLANARGYAGTGGTFNADLMLSIDNYAQNEADEKFDQEEEYEDWVNEYNQAWDQRASEIEKNGHVLSLYVKTGHFFHVATDSYITEDEAERIIQASRAENFLRKAFLDDIKRLHHDGEGRIKTSDFANGNFSVYLTQALNNLGYDGIIDSTVNEKFTLMKGTEHLVVFNAQHVKQSDPVTYDDDGNVIPLSARFNEGTQDIRYSLKTDSEGRKLSDEQAEFFRDSTARDENGNLLTLYHGTRKGGFTVFRDWSYLTADRKYADQYADKDTGETTYEVYANIRKPFDTRLPEVREVWENEFFGNYSRTELQESGLPDWTDGYDLAEWIEEEGLDYDGILLDEGAVPDENGGVMERGISYVVRSSEQIKNVGNRTPTDNPDIRHSLAGGMDNARLLRENQKLRDRVEYWKGQTKKSDRAKVEPKEVKKLARRLATDFSSAMDRTEIAGELQAIYDGLGKDWTYDQAYEAAHALAMNMVEQASESDGFLYNEYETMRVFFRETPLVISPEIKRGITDYNDWRKAQMGRLRLQSGELSNIDQVYQEISQLWPEWFDEEREVTSLDQLERIVEVMDGIYVQEETNPFQDDLEGPAGYLTAEIMDSFWDLPNVKKTWADRAEARLGREVTRRLDLQEKYQEKLRQVREDRDRKLKQKSAEYLGKKRAASQRQKERERRAQIMRHARDLSKKLLKPSDKQHIPQQLREAVAAVLDSVNLASRNFKETNRTKAFQELRLAYQDILQQGESLVIDPDLMDNISEVEAMRDTPIAEMDLSQLETIWRTIRAVEASITTANKAFGRQRFATIFEAADGLRQAMGNRKDRGEYRGPVGAFDKLLNSGMLTPESFFHRMGQTGQDIFRMLRNAQDRHIGIMQEAQDYTEKIVGKTKVRKWEKEVHTFDFNGEKVQMTTAQIMSLYELLKRQQAVDHIVVGGIKPEGVDRGVKKKAPAEPYRLTIDQISEIVDSLTEEQVEMADALQKYMGGRLAQLGNEASMAVYGYEKFNEKNYFPIKVDKNQTITDQTKEAQAATIAGRGFTKSTTPKANNALIVRNIFDVYADHVTDMATYSSWLEAMENLQRIYNFTFRDAEGNRTGTVKANLERAFGKNGLSYWEKLTEDLNNGVHGTNDNPFNSLIGNYKASAIGANIRVFIQQPTAILRALDDINPADFLAGLGRARPTTWSKVKKYAPIAVWKDWGYFDADTGRQMKSILFGDDSALAKVNNGLMAPAGAMDSLAWSHIWNALEAETRRTRKDLKPRTDEFYQAVAARFNAVIDHSQVVDGILQRSQVMRSPDALTKMATSFMAEPTKVYNMFTTAVYDLKHSQDPKARTQAMKVMGRTTFALIASFFANAAAQSLVDALRDDDKDEDYWEKFFQAFYGLEGDEETTGAKIKNGILEGNLGAAFNPATYIPWVKDALSLIQGFKVSRMDMDSISKFVQEIGSTWKAFHGDGKITLQNALTRLTAEGARLLGIPASNIKRDVLAIYSTAMNSQKNYLGQFELQKWLYRMDNANNQTEFVKIAYAAQQAGDLDAYEKIKAELVDAMGQEKYDEKMKNLTKKDMEAGGDLENRVADTYGAYETMMAGNPGYQSLTAEQQAKVQDSLTGYAQMQVTEEASGGELVSNDNEMAAIRAAEQAGIDPVTWKSFKVFCADTSADKKEDGTSIRGSKKAKVEAWLDDNEITGIAREYCMEHYN